MKSFVEEKSAMDKSSYQLFDNPLRREFLTLEQVIDFFGYTKKWVKRQMAEGRMPYHCYGRSKFLFYIPDIRQAILSGRLAPERKVQDDYNSKDKKRNQISRSSQSERGQTLEDIRNERRSREMGELCAFSS
jgi:hypothetical protein